MGNGGIIEEWDHSGLQAGGGHCITLYNKHLLPAPDRTGRGIRGEGARDGGRGGGELIGSEVRHTDIPWG